MMPFLHHKPFPQMLCEPVDALEEAVCTAVVGALRAVEVGPGHQGVARGGDAVHELVTGGHDHPATDSRPFCQSGH